MNHDNRLASEIADLLTAAERAFNVEDYDNAEAAGREVLAKSPGHGNAIRLLAMVERVRGNHAKAVAMMEQAIQSLSGIAEAHSDLGKAYESAGDYFRAAAAFRNAAALAPERAAYHTRYVEALAEASHVAQGLPILGRGALRSYAYKLQSGFFQKYLSGPHILDIGFRGDLPAAEPIVKGAVGIDVGYPGYDGLHLPFADMSQDAVHSSHSLEHFADPGGAIREWHRVLKIGGFLVIVVPHQFLYERKKLPPSYWNHDHKHFFSPGKLLGVVESVLAPNSYRVRHLADDDFMFDYATPALRAPGWGYNLELVLERIAGPAWTLG